MNVKKITPIKSELIEMENGQMFVRNASDDWDELYGNSSEGLSLSDCEKLENSYQSYKAKISFAIARGGTKPIEMAIKTIIETNPELSREDALEIINSI